MKKNMLGVGALLLALAVTGGAVAQEKQSRHQNQTSWSGALGPPAAATMSSYGNSLIGAVKSVSMSSKIRRPMIESGCNRHRLGSDFKSVGKRRNEAEHSTNRCRVLGDCLGGPVVADQCGDGLVFLSPAVRAKTRAQEPLRHAGSTGRVGCPGRPEGPVVFGGWTRWEFFTWPAGSASRPLVLFFIRRDCPCA